MLDPRRPIRPETSEASRPGSGFEVHANTSVQHITLLTVTGPLDAESEADLMTAARFALASAYALVLDLRGLTRCDPAGVRAVVEVDALARAVDAQLVVRPAGDAVHRVFVECGAAGRLRFVGPARRG